MIYYLAGGDITKIDTVTAMNANTAFTFLSLEKSDKKLIEWARR